MATLRAGTSFSDFKFTLYETMFAQEGSTLGDNVNRGIGGATFQDVASYETRNSSGYHSYYFGGTGLSRDTDTSLLAGTVTGFSRYAFRLDDFTTPELRITGISVAAGDIGAAMKSQDSGDDRALAAILLSF